MGEESNTEFNQNPSVDKTPEVYSDRLHKIFGIDAVITQGEHSYKASLTLQDATCPGGQNVDVILDEIKERPGLNKAKGFTVDGTSMLDILGCDIYFNVSTSKEENKMDEKKSSICLNPFRLLKKRSEAKSAPKSQEDDNNSTFSEYLNKFKGTKAFAGQGIVMTNFEDADGLAALLHEAGHMQDGTFSASVNELHEYTVIKYLHDKGRGYKKSELPEIRQSAEEILNYEMRANRNGVGVVQHSRNRGVDFFKGDDELFRLKKFLVSTTLTRCNQNPRFVNLVCKERINEILSL